MCTGSVVVRQDWPVQTFITDETLVHSEPGIRFPVTFQVVHSPTRSDFNQPDLPIGLRCSVLLSRFPSSRVVIIVRGSGIRCFCGELPPTSTGALPPPSPHDWHTMPSRTPPSDLTKNRVTTNPPASKPDPSTSPGVGVKTRRVLPRLPVPPLRSTLDKYLQSVKPLLQEDHLRGVSPFASAYQQRVQWAKEFEMGIGAILQARLLGTRCFLSIFIVPISCAVIFSLRKNFTAQLAR